MAAIVLAAVAVPATAHVQVLPSTATVEQSQEFTVRVPTERPLPTIAVRVEFPPGMTVYAFAPPPPGWRMQVISRNGSNVAVRYYGGRIPVQQYQDFRFLATPTKTGQAAWKALQTYADGKVKPWTGKPEAPGAVSSENGPTDPGPASATLVTASPAPAGTAADASAGQSSTSGGGGSSDAGVWLGLIAIAIAALAAVGTGLLWSSRPAKLPEGD
jgi:uncharacterized protein YcnI